MTSSLSKQRPPAPWELLLWSALFFALFLTPSTVSLVPEVDGLRLPLHPSMTSLLQRLLSLALVLLLGIGSVLLGERYLLIEKGERPTMLLFLLAFFATTPCSSLTIGVALLASWLLLFLQLGTYQDTHQHQTYLLLGVITGGVSLVQPLYLVLLPLLLWGGYHLRSLSVRSIVALLVGLVLPLWIALPLVALQGPSLLEEAYAWLLQGLPLPDPRLGAPFELLAPVSYLLFVLLYLLGIVLYQRRYYRENVRQRDMLSMLGRYPLLLLGVIPLLGREAVMLLPVLFLPLSLLLARGLGALPAKLAKAFRLLLLGLCLGSFLYEQGFFSALLQRLF